MALLDWMLTLGEDYVHHLKVLLVSYVNFALLARRLCTCFVRPDGFQAHMQGVRV